MRDALESFTRDVQNFEKAPSRITATAAFHGGQEPAAVGWLLSFLSRDVGTLNEWEREEVLWNVVRFAFDAGQGWFTDLGRLGALDLHYPETAAARTNALAQIQKDTRATLADYLKTGVGTFPKGDGAFAIVRGNQPLRYNGGDLFSSFYYMAAQLLSKYRHRVKRCEGCTLLMLVGRKDQRFHSQGCQIAAFVRNKRAKDKAARLAKEAARKSRTRKHNKNRAEQKGGKRHGTKR